jgi:2-hydroxychromene-2-carboxylate isomerase
LYYDHGWRSGDAKTEDDIMKTLDFIFDFGSPNAYLSWKVLPAILERTGAHLNVVPVLLGGLFKLTGNQPPMVAFGGVKGKLAYEQLESQRFMRKHAIHDFRLNPHFPVNTLLIMRGLIAARHMGVEGKYIEAVLAAMWEDGKKMDDTVVAIGVLSAAGLDAQAILAATQDPVVKAELAANTEAAALRGVFGVPSFFGKERLGQVEEALCNARKNS